MQMDDVVIQVAVCLGLGANLCEARAHAVSLWMPVARTGWPAREAQDVTPAARHCSTTTCGVRCCVPRSRPAKEPAGLSRSDGKKRPDGVSLIPWSRGRCVTWDVMSADTLAPSHIPSSATQALSAAARAEAAKTMKYSALAIASCLCR